MDRLDQILSEFHTSDSNLDVYRSILESSSDGNQDEVLVEFPTMSSKHVSESIHILRNILRNPNNNVLSASSMLQLTAIALSNIRASNDYNDILLKCELILLVCSLPTATAYGLINNNLLNAISSTLNKAVNLEFKLKPQVKISSTRTLSSKTKLAEVTRGSRASKRLGMDSNKMGDSDDESDGDDEVVKEYQADGDDDDELVTRDHRSTQVIRMNTSTLHTFLSCLRDTVKVYTSRKEESCIDQLIESVSGVLFLSSLRSEFIESASVAESIMVSIASTSFPMFAAVIRALLPALTYTGRDARLPEGGKQRNLCHNASIAFILQLLSHFYASASLHTSWYAPVDSQPVVDEMDTIISSTSPKEDNDDKDDDMKAVSGDDMSSGENLSSVTCFNKSIIGIMERMTILSPDRAPVRQAILTSILKIISHIATLPSISTADDGSNSIYDRPQQMTTCYLSFLCKLCKSTKISFRSFGVEIISALLLPSTSSSSQTLDVILWSDDVYETNMLLYILIRRCNDVAPTVRLRGLTAVNDIMTSLSRDSPAKLLSTILQYALGYHVSSYDNDSSSSVLQPRLSLAAESSDSSSTHDKNYINLIEIIRNRTQDQKPMVKAKAIQAYSLALSMSWPRISSDIIDSSSLADDVTMLLTEEDIDIFVHACNDASSITIRKQGLLALTQLMTSRPSDILLQEAWIGSVLPLVADGESTITQKLASVSYEMIFDRLMIWMKSKQASDRHSSLLWQLCTKIASSRREGLLRSCVLLMIKQGLITSQSMKSLYKAIWTACSYGDHHHDAADNILGLRQEEPEMICKTGWIILEALINHPIPNTDHTTTSYLQDINFSDTIVSYYRHKTSSSIVSSSLEGHIDVDDDMIRIIKILDQLSFSLSSEQVTYLQHEMDKILFSFKYNHPQLLSAAIALRYSLSSSSSPGRAVCHDVAMRWCQPLLHHIWMILHAVVWHEHDSQDIISIIKSSSSSNNAPSMSWLQSIIGNEMMSKSAATCALYLLGEIILLGFSSDEDENSFHKPSSSSRGYMTSKINEKLMKMVIPDGLTQLIQLMMGHHYPISSVSSDMMIIPAEFRAFAFVTMGKLCLRSQRLARDNINIYLREIQDIPASHHDVGDDHNDDNITSFMVRNNALLILSDFCIRYTNLIERHIETIAISLQDPSIIIRRHTLILLSSLILQDYIKFKSNILFRFLCCLLDDNVEFHELSKVIIHKIIQAKYPDFLSLKFSEAIVLFNECYDHPVLEASHHMTIKLSHADISSSSLDHDLPSSDENNEVYHISGAKNASKRMIIYEFMMDGLSEEQRIQVTAKIMQDILSSAADRSNINIPLSCSESQVIHDTIMILQSPMLKITRKSLSHEHDVDEDVDEAMNNDPTSSQSSSSGTGGQGGKENAITRAKIRVLKVLSKQHMINHILPVTMSLKHMLEAQHSSLQGSLMEYLLYLMSQHKAEVSEALNADPILKLELEYDMKNYEKNKERQRLAEVEAAMQSSSTKNMIASASSKKMVRLSAGESMRRSSFNNQRRMSMSKDSLPSLKKSAGSTRRLSSNVHDNDDNEDDIADRLAMSVAIEEDSHLDRLKNKRWSISLPASFGNDDTSLAADENDEVNTAAEKITKDEPTKPRKTKRQPAGKDTKTSSNMVEVDSSTTILSPVKKRVNNQPTPDLSTAKSSSRTRTRASKA